MVWVGAGEAGWVSPVLVEKNLLSWASDIEPGTVAQAARTARLPFLAGHVALMPYAHIGIGATVGSVIPTADAIIRAAVGVDIGSATPWPRGPAWPTPSTRPCSPRPAA